MDGGMWVLGRGQWGVDSGVWIVGVDIGCG